MFKFRRLTREQGAELRSIQKARLIDYRSQPVVFRLQNPTRRDRAHAIGFRAKQGFIVSRVRVVKGKRKRPKPSGGRKPKKAGRFFSLGKSKQVVAEQKAQRKYPNMQVIGSYFLAEDGNHKWFEVILADPFHPSIAKGRETGWISKVLPGRAHRGLTPAGRKSRGLRRKGIGAEKLRPSRSSNIKKRLNR